MKIKHILIVSLFPGRALFAQNWTGAVNSDWNNAANASVRQATEAFLQTTVTNGYLDTLGNAERHRKVKLR